MIKIIINLLKVIINVLIFILLIPINIIRFILKIFMPNNNSAKKDNYFDKEAKLYNMSKEDKKIAKEERMSPSDYIEAEENDDDNLDYDK